MGNSAKRIQIRKLLGHLAKGIENQFYFESIHIAYAIIEDRTISLIASAQICLSNTSSFGPLLKTKLDALEDAKQNINELKDSVKGFDSIFVDLNKWREARNSITHDLANDNRKYTDLTKDCEKMAKDGLMFSKNLCTIVYRLKKKMKKAL